MKNMNPITKITALLAIFVILPFSFLCSQDQSGSTQYNELIVFYSPVCKHCLKAKNEIIPQIQKEFQGKLEVVYSDITRIENYKLFLTLQQMYGVQLADAVPIFYIAGHFLDDWKEDKAVLVNFINESIKFPFKPKDSFVSVDLLRRFESFKPLAIVSAGLIDGINPCAFTVMVFFISFLALQGYRKRELIAVGLSFLFAVFTTYVLIGLGLMGIFYKLKGFWVFSKIINMAIGIFSITLGIFAVYDLFLYMYTQKTEGLLLQLPKTVKNRIHSIVGAHYRGQAKTGIFKLILSAFVVGFLISILEAVCTGQVYLPTITFVLWTTPFKFQALGLLLLYNIMFVVPLFIVFILALLGTTSEQFSFFLKKHLVLIKILMAAVFFSFGIVLISSNMTFVKHKSNKETYKVSYSLPDRAIKPAETKDRGIWDFGRVKAGEVLKHSFVLKNNLDKPLKIINVSTSCGCTASEVKKKSLLPGEETAIEVKFDTKNYSGEVKQYVYITTDNPEESLLRFTIKAQIEK